MKNEYTEIVIKEFPGGHGRVGEITIDNYECFLCGETKTVVDMDGSEGEYGTAPICADCVVRECKKYEDDRRKEKTEENQ